MKKNILGFFFLLFSMCSTKIESGNDITTIKIDLDSAKRGSLSEIFESVSYVLLKTDVSNSLVWPHSVKVSRKGEFYIRDVGTQSLMVFDAFGNFLRAYEPKGKGPQEFFQMVDFQISDNKVIIFDMSLGKLIDFDHQGEFLDERRFIKRFLNFYKTDDYILNFTSYSADYDLYSFVKTNLPTEECVGFFKFPESKLNLGNFDFPTGFMETFEGNRLYFNVPFSTQVAQFEITSGTLSSIFNFDFGKYTMSEELFKLGKQEMYKVQEENNLVRQLTAFFPFQDFYFVAVSQGMGKKKHYMLLDKNKKPIFHKYNLVNDLDGMTILGSPWSFSANGVIHMVASRDFLSEYKQTFAGKDTSNSPDGIHQFVQENEDKLIDDYHVLVLYKLKANFNSAFG